MHYQLFIPNAESKTAPQALVGVGLADLVQGCEAMPVQGPDDKHGLLCCWRKPGTNQKFHYNANEQTWIPGLKNGAESVPYYIGFWNDSPVTPDDLQRPYSHIGKRVRLGDGHEWRFPIMESLPKDLILADDGSWRFEIQRQYHDLWIESMDWIERLTRETTHDFGKIADYCVRCLRQNYRLLPEVVSYLKLLNTQNVQTALGASLGLEFAHEQ